jgi:hypothetical protein
MNLINKCEHVHRYLVLIVNNEKPAVLVKNFHLFDMRNVHINVGDPKIPKYGFVISYKYWYKCLTGKHVECINIIFFYLIKLFLI